VPGRERVKDWAMAVDARRKRSERRRRGLSKALGESGRVPFETSPPAPLPGGEGGLC
jgi:hypothetical protein